MPIGDDQRMTLDEALRAHTIDAAVAIGMEDRIGSLQPGKFADITVIDGVLEATAPEQIASLGTWMTMLDGEVAWSATGEPITATRADA
jgi:predicted amidohydrolase YtcJ